MTTIAAFCTAVGGLTVTGVTKKVDYRPASIHTADLPFQFVELPSSDSGGEFVSTCNDLGKTRTVDLVVCLEAINQNNPEPNYDATVAMMDALETALDAYEASSDLIIEYSISAGRKAVGDADYWAATATVTGTDT